MIGNRLTGATLLMGALALGACSGGDGEASEAGVEKPAAVLAPTDVAIAQRESMNAGVVMTGTLNPHRIVEVRAQIGGLLTNLRVDRGQRVGVGQVLAVIQAEGIRGQAEGARAGVASARANLALARRQLESARKLHGAGAMSDIEFQQAETGFEAAQANVVAAQAQAAGASENAQRATITSPITGEVSDRLVSAGEAVNPGQTLVTVVDGTVLELNGQVPVNAAAQIRPGMAVEFTIDAYPGRAFRGTVSRIDPTADAGTRQVGVYARLPNPGRQLVGGLFATGRIITGSSGQSVTVPIAAVRGDGSATYVWVVRNNVTAKQSVQVGTRDESRGVAQIVSGLTGGERVIASPGEVTEGMSVRVATGANAAEAR